MLWLLLDYSADFLYGLDVLVRARTGEWAQAQGLLWARPQTHLMHQEGDLGDHKAGSGDPEWVTLPPSDCKSPGRSGVAQIVRRGTAPSTMALE